MSADYGPAIAGQGHYETAKTRLSDASDIHPAFDEGAAADRAIAEAQVHASMAIYEALADIAAELTMIRRQREPS